jgi:hypothetical protein
VSSAKAIGSTTPLGTGKSTSHSAKFGRTGLASWPFTETRFTVPPSDVVPRTTQPFAPNLAEVWAPAIASLSITLLVFFVPLGIAASRRVAISPVAAGWPASRSRAWLAARWLAIATALIGLNFAGAVYRPLRGPGELRPSPYLFFDSATFLDEQGDFLMRLKLSRPRSVKSSMRSFVEVWFPAIASASVTALVLNCVWRQVQRQRTEVVAVRHMRAAPGQD